MKVSKSDSFMGICWDGRAQEILSTPAKGTDEGNQIFLKI